MKQHQARESVAETVRELTDTIESHKEEKKRKRQEKIQAEERKRKLNTIERSVAPVILVFTILLCLAIMVFSR